MSLTVDNKILEEVQQSLVAYLPGGPLWESGFVPGTNLNAVMAGISGLLLDTEIFNQIYNSEFIPSAEGTSFLENWEQAVSIPDECFPGPAISSREDRRRHVLVKLASLGVQTADDFVQLASVFGITASVIPGVEAGITPEEVAIYTILVELPVPEEVSFPLVFPILFNNVNQSIIQCLFTKLKPENCQILFAWESNNHFVYGFPITFGFNIL